MLTFYEVKEDASLQDHTTFCSTSALIVSSFLDKDNSNTDAQEKEAMQSLIWSLIYEVKWTKQKSKHTPTALSSASKSWMMSWKEADKLMKSRLCFKRSPELREKPDARANTQCASPFYTVLKEMLPEVQGLERWCGLLEKGWKQHQEQQMFIISHTNAHAQCYWHISPDSHDEPSQFRQKIVSFLPTALQLKCIIISVTSSLYRSYLPVLHSATLRVYIPRFSFFSLVPLCCSLLLSLNAGCALYVEGHRKGCKERTWDRTKAGKVVPFFPGVVTVRKCRNASTAFSLPVELRQL